MHKYPGFVCAMRSRGGHGSASPGSRIPDAVKSALSLAIESSASDDRTAQVAVSSVLAALCAHAGPAQAAPVPVKEKIRTLTVR